MKSEQHADPIVQSAEAVPSADEERDQLAAMLELAPVAIVACDLQDRVTFWNPGAEALYGWSAAEARGQVTHDLLQTVFPKSREDVACALAADGITLKLKKPDVGPGPALPKHVRDLRAKHDVVFVSSASSLDAEEIAAYLYDHEDHALKGAAATLGAERVRGIALDLELRGREMSLVGAEASLLALEDAVGQALAALSAEAARAP